jgi:glycosyltransferase involved in cell wall biosynthesis
MSGVGTTVTVVIPVWDDYVRYLGDAVESVLRSAPQPPIVIVDNASSTPVPELEGCEVVRSTRRLSEGAARNLGFERVRGEFVLFLDADDMLLEDALAWMHGRIAADRDVAVAACSILDSSTGERHRSPRRLALRLARCRRTFAFANSIWSLMPIQGCGVLRTEQVREAGGYADADVGEDWDLAVSLAWRGRVEISERLGRYYRTGEGSAARRGRSAAELRKTAHRVRKRLRRDGAVPAWAKVMLPIIAILQLVAIYVLRPFWRVTRRVLGRVRSYIR